MKNILFICFFLLNFELLIAQEDSLTPKQPLLTFESKYIGDFVNVLDGGIQKGSVYLGLFDLSSNVSLSNLGFFKNSNIKIRFLNTHGQSPSANYIGDYQVCSNIDAGNHSILYELYYQQEIKNLSFKLGIQDLNSDMLVNDHSCNLNNSSFGVIPTLSSNLNLSIFPKPTLGATFIYNIKDKSEIKTSIYATNIEDFSTDENNTNFNYNFNDGIISITEYAIKFKKSKYKLGVFYQNKYINPFNNVVIDNYGGYFMLEQKMKSEKNSEEQGLCSFISLGYSPEEFNSNDIFVGGGFHYTGLFKKRDDDILHLGFAYAKLSNPYIDMFDTKESETAIELTYKFNNSNYTIQPNIQYIINPGMSKEVSNALVATLRVILNIAE